MIEVDAAPLPRTEALTERVLALPTGTAMRAPEITAIGEIIDNAVADGGGR